MFKAEIYRVGGRLPKAIYFAIHDESTAVDSNFEIFKSILVEPPGSNKIWQSGREAWFEGVISLADEDFPATLGDAVGSGASSTSKPRGKDETMPQIPDDVPMGVSSSEVAGGSQAASVGSRGEQVTYYAAEADSGLTGSFASFHAMPETPSSVLSPAASSGLVNLIIFPRNPSAAVMLQNERPQYQRIYDIAGATCIDAAAEQLLMRYVLKMNDIVRWRTGWDRADVAELTSRALQKGQIRDGPGNCGSYNYGEDPPPYRPLSPMQEAEMQAVMFLDYSLNECGIVASMWRNVSDKGTAERAKDKIIMQGDIRRSLVLKVVRAMSDKPKCSFTTPLALYREDDVYYFPNGAAFTSSEKPTAFMAASILAVNPDSKMDEKSRKMGQQYVNRGFELADGPSHGPSTAASSAIVRQRPAAAGPGSGRGKGGKDAKK
jgi:hypothetical protein